MGSSSNWSARRKFLGLLAASPALAYAGFKSGLVEKLLEQPLAAQNVSGVPRLALTPREQALSAPEDVVISSVKEALTIMDFYNYCRAHYPPVHHLWYTGGFYNETIRANVEAFSKYQIRKRFLTGLDKIDMSVNIFGVKWETPLYFCPGGGGNMLHLGVNGNIALANACKATGT